MKITDVKTYLVAAYRPGGWAARNWCIVEVHTDEGITGIGEASGWPRVIQQAVEDFKGVIVGEDPGRIERIWQKMFIAQMGHGVTGVVGGGAMTGIEIALWDILGKAVNKPICDLIGGRIRDTVRVYAHAGNVDRAQELRDRGFDALKCSRLESPVQLIRDVRRALGDEVDLMTDVHGPPWYSVPDAIRVGQELEEYDVLFYEDPVPPENVDALAKVSAGISVPLAAGERYSNLWGFREIIEREIVDVVQPDMGRAGGFMQMKKIAAMAEAHYIGVAPHDGSNGPIAEAAAVHLMASIPNCLILEHLEDDVPWRYDLATPLKITNGQIEVPTGPGLGIEFNPEVALAHPAERNLAPPSDAVVERTYVQARPRRSRLFRTTD
ncbi:MAG: mandelate racemase/muconate lactonizing enzyme family protein [Chloroflexi bacterium]|nr:mandelate racemase/muconate lactonizing enzyme family protein [Chloroflexota bacterium]